MTPPTIATAVVSELLCDLPDAPAEQREQYGAALVRALGLTNPDPDFAATAATERDPGRRAALRMLRRHIEEDEL